MSLSETEINTAASLLAKLEAGFLPQRLFDQITRLHVTATVVCVPLKQTAEGPQVLLIQRGSGAHDPVWPGYWHLPGGMIRPTDTPGSYRDVFERILQGEMKGVPLAGEPVFVQTTFADTRRGRELAQIYYVLLEGEPTVGAFFPVDKLPEPIIEHEPPYVRAALKQAGLDTR